jgi:tetratricopeptide (TPR) repeat protein
MAVAKVLRLDEYRDRRVHRLTLARALSRTEPTRSAVFGHLSEVADLTGADRVAAIWIDEFGSGVVHPHTVLDLLSDRPRRGFPTEPLIRAWEAGIPGSYDEASVREAGSPSTLALALGSDGTRAWFLWAESVTGRPELDASIRDRLMFLAGEVSAVVLHRDLGRTDDAEGRASFAGWRLLKDLEGHESDRTRSRLVARRFIVVRLASMLVEEGLCLSDERRAEQVKRAKDELALEGGDKSPEAPMLDAVLDAYEEGDLGNLGGTLLALGEAAERLDHHHGAREAYECCYEIGAATGDGKLAIDAARKVGRVLRRRAQWRGADHWYEVALDVSRSTGNGEMAARALAGLGLIKREIGNFPAARERFEEALLEASGAGAIDAVASVHHDLMGLEQLAGDLETALDHGWTAVNRYRSEVGRTRCLAGLAGVLRDLGDLEAAEDAYLVVAHTSDEHYYRIYAYDALAYIAARRNEPGAFRHWATQCDALDWESGPAAAKVEILLYRGLSYGLLHRLDEARSWLRRAVSFAEEHEFNRVLFQAESALKRYSRRRTKAQETDSTPAPTAVKDGLRAMRLAYAAAGGTSG